MSEEKGFKPGRKSDSDEAKAGETHIQPTNKKASVNLPAGQWVDVPKGMVAAPGTYTDENGVLRDATDHSCVVWHSVGRRQNALGFLEKVRCERTGIHASEIVYDPATGAPWCPDCWARRETMSELSETVSSQAQSRKN